MWPIELLLSRAILLRSRTNGLESRVKAKALTVPPGDRLLGPPTIQLAKTGPLLRTAQRAFLTFTPTSRAFLLSHTQLSRVIMWLMPP